MNLKTYLRTYQGIAAHAAMSVILLIAPVVPGVAQSTSHETLSPDTVLPVRIGDYYTLNQYTDIQDNGKRITVLVNGRQVEFASDAQPFIVDGTIMVPAIPILRAEHAFFPHAGYTNSGSQFTALGPGEALTVRVGSRIATGANAHQFSLPAEVQSRNGTLYVPMQVIPIVIGQNLSFDRESQTVAFGARRATVSPR